MASFTSFSKKEISQFFASAQRVLKHPGLTILMAPKSAATGRLLIVTPRKIGNAPKRNKIRRRLKALFYEEKLSEGSFDCACIMRKEGTILSFSELKDLLLKAVTRWNNATQASSKNNSSDH